MDVAQVIRERAVSIVYQPILDISNQQIFGFEALARGPAGSLFSPLNLFRVAQKNGLLHEAEMLCLSRALEESKCLPTATRVFVNISPDTLLKSHSEVLRMVLRSDYDIVLELAEVGVSAKKQSVLNDVLADIRIKGTKIALDDIGSGDRDFKNICEIPSDFLKIDRGIIEGLTKNNHYQAALKALVTIARDLDSHVIAEGVENPKQLEAIKAAGIGLVQGFLISKPMSVAYWNNYKKEVSVC